MFPEILSYHVFELHKERNLLDVLSTLPLINRRRPWRHHTSRQTLKLWSTVRQETNTISARSKRLNKMQCKKTKVLITSCIHPFMNIKVELYVD